MTYDAANRLTQTANALSTPSDPRVWTREYDAAGRLIARTDANGTRNVQTYNAEGQLASIDYPNGRRIAYNWTCCRMKSMRDDYGESIFTYDIANRLVSVRDAQGFTLYNRYDAVGRRAALTLPDNSVYAYDYDVFGEIDDISGPCGVSTLTRDASRRLDTWQYGPPTTGNTPVAVSYTWSPTVLTATGGINTDSVTGLFGEEFAPADPQMPGASPLNTTDADWTGTSNATDMYAVRRDLRVLTDAHSGGTSTMDIAYAYDVSGNRTERKDMQASPLTGSYEYFNAANQLTGQQVVAGNTLVELDVALVAGTAQQQQNITTDKNGNITQIDYYQMVYVDADPDPAWERRLTFTWHFRFDFENRLTEARGTQHAIPDALDPSDDDPAPIPAAYFNYEFGYDGLGRRVWTQKDAGDGSWFIYDGDQLVQERNFRSDALVVEYAWGPTATGGPAIFYQNRHQANEDGSDQERWIYTSPQGQFPRHLFDDTGAITDTFQYSSFGELVFHEGTTEVGFGWRQSFAPKSDAILLKEAKAYSPILATAITSSIPLGSFPANAVGGKLPSGAKACAKGNCGQSLAMAIQMPDFTMPAIPGLPDIDLPSVGGNWFSDLFDSLKDLVVDEILELIGGTVKKNVSSPPTPNHYGCADQHFGTQTGNDCFSIAAHITSDTFLKECCKGDAQGLGDCLMFECFEDWAENHWRGRTGDCGNPCQSTDLAPGCQGYVACFFCKCKPEDLMATFAVDCVGAGQLVCIIQEVLKLTAGWFLKCSQGQCD